MSIIFIIIICFFVLIFLAVPISFALLFASSIYFYAEGINLKSIITNLVFTYKSFLLLSIPFFILTGKIMDEAKISEKLVDFADLLVGSFKGGLAYVNIIVSMFFGGCTGSAISDTSAIGGILIPTMVKKGYTKSFSAAVTAASSTMGPIIPPSILFILYGATANVSIRDLFLGGLIPGLCVGLGQMIYVASIAKKNNFPKRYKKIGLKEVIHITEDASWALALPVIILGGITFGIVTPTEAAVVSVIYSTFISFFIYRTLSFKDMTYILREAAVEIGQISILIASSALFGWILVVEEVPAGLANFLFNSGLSNIMILLLLNLALFVTGMFLDSFPAILMVTPVFLPIYNMIGLDLIHAGIFSCMNLTMGVITPPVGCCLFAASVISKESYDKVVVAILPFVAINMAVTLLMTYVPQITLFLPNLIK